MRRLSAIVVAALVVRAVGASAQSDDPPARVGRVSVAQGNVSLYPVGDTAWTDASINYPVTSGDAVWADTSARAEIQLGSSAVRIAPQTSLVFGEVSDTVTQMRVDQGSIDVHVRYLSDDEVYEIDTPAGVISLLDEGHYRIDVTPDGRRATISVRDGGAQVQFGDRSVNVAAGSAALLTGDDRPPVTIAAVPDDEWERWADARAAHEDAVPATDYVSRDMVGYEDLDANGSWQVDPAYGSVWIPRTVPVGWAPYRFGHWESVAPWGWTWIDDASWGFAPFHYGRWAYLRGRWGWVPGSIQLRPTYAPALVAFVNGPGWSVGVSAGGPGVGWLPLAPGEPYVPAYRASPAYVRRVNMSSVDLARVNPAQIDVDRIRYANRTAPNAVTVVPRDVFVRSRPVGRSTITVRAQDVAVARPSAVPVAGGERVIAPEHPAPVFRGRSGIVARPPTVPNAHAEPPRPEAWHPRPRPASPATDAQRNPPAARPSAPPVAQPEAPPTTRRPEMPPARSPRESGPPSPRPAAQTQPDVPPAPPAADTSRTRHPRESGPPSPRPTPEAQPLPAPAPAGRPAMDIRPRPANPPAADKSAEWQQRRAQLIAHQQQEAADLDRRHSEQLHAAHGNTAQLQRQQQQEKQQLNQRQQRERDQLDKQYRRPGGQQL